MKRRAFMSRRLKPPIDEPYDTQEAANGFAPFPRKGEGVGRPRRFRRSLIESFSTDAGETIHPFDLYGLATRPALVWNFMKTTATREAAVQREPRKSSPVHAKTSSTRPAASDWVWPGLTRAELRAIVIDQIG